MGCNAMRRMLLAGLTLLALTGCGGNEDANLAEGEADVTPQIASLEDYGMPVDKSDQITSIDAATSDASGMPRDGGAAVELKRPETREANEAPERVLAIPAAAPPPPLVIPEPPPPAAPALTVPVGN